MTKKSTSQVDIGKYLEFLDAKMLIQGHIYLSTSNSFIINLLKIFQLQLFDGAGAAQSQGLVKNKNEMLYFKSKLYNPHFRAN